MSYDQLTYISVGIFLAGYGLFRFWFFNIKPLTVIKKSELAALRKANIDLQFQVEMLTKQVNMVWNGEITKERTGQQRMFDDVPVVSKHDVVRQPYTVRIDGTLKRYNLVWDRADYNAYQAGKLYVVRDKRYIWIDETDQRRGDRVVIDNNHVVRATDVPYYWEEVLLEEAAS